MIKKILTVCLTAFLILASASTAFATSSETPEHLLTVICTPQLGDTELTEHDIVVLRMYCLTDGNNYSFNIYGYNNFTNKFMMPEGEYMVTEISVKDRSDIVLFNHTSNFVVKDSTTLKVPLTNSALVETNPIEDDTTVVLKETTTYYNPFNPSVPSTSTPDATEITSGQEDTTTHIPEPNETTSSNDSTYTTSPFITMSESTTADSGNSEKLDGSISTIVFVLIIVLLLAVIVFFIILKKRNED